MQLSIILVETRQNRRDASLWCIQPRNAFDRVVDFRHPDVERETSRRQALTELLPCGSVVEVSTLPRRWPTLLDVVNFGKSLRIVVTREGLGNHGHTHLPREFNCRTVKLSG